MTISRAALLLVPVVVVLPGCVAPLVVGAAAGVGAVEYSRGELNGAILARLDQTMPVLVAMARELKWDIRERRQDATDAFLRAGLPDGRQVDITLKRRGGDSTGVSIRVGIFGDEVESRRILEDLRARARKVTG